jgi:hypothetical protein
MASDIGNFMSIERWLEYQVRCTCTSDAHAFYHVKGQ